MNIVVVGAGAIGSLFGGLLASHHQVTLLGRQQHMQAVKDYGLKITGKTTLHVLLNAVTSAQDINDTPDLILLTVKAYDTKNAVQDIRTLLGENSLVLTLQNGLDNLEIITSILGIKNILAGVTTHGAILEKPGTILHTGKGTTSIGELHGQQTTRLKKLVHEFNKAGIETRVTSSIQKEIWMKAIVNASINTLTALFECKNGVLDENPLLHRFVEIICAESTQIAQTHNIPIRYEEAIQRTKEVINQTSENRSSMLQSLDKKKPTEIQAITGALINKGKQQGCTTEINQIIYQVISSLDNYK